MRSTVVTKLSLQMLAALQDGGACAVNPGSPTICYLSPKSPFCKGDLCFGSAKMVRSTVATKLIGKCWWQ